MYRYNLIKWQIPSGQPTTLQTGKSMLTSSTFFVTPIDWKKCLVVSHVCNQLLKDIASKPESLGATWHVLPDCFVSSGSSSIAQKKQTE